MVYTDIICSKGMILYNLLVNREQGTPVKKKS